MIENQFLWKKQRLVETSACGARLCYVIRSEPLAEDQSHYSVVTSWMDEKTLFPIRVEKIVGVPPSVKEFTYFGLRQSKGVWSASQVEAKTKGQPGSSLLIITAGTEKANVPASQFDPALLTKPD